MSVVNKKPYIETVLASLNTTQLTEVKRLLNNQVQRNFRSLITAGSLITNADKDTPLRVDCELELGNIKSGILIYTNTLCVLIAYNRFLNVILYKLNIAAQTYEKLDDECDVEEFRRILEDLLITGGDVEITPTALAEALEGSDTVVVDLNQEQDKLQVRLDQDVIDAIKLKEITDDDITITPDTTATTITLAGGIVEATAHIHLMWEVEGTGIHYGGDVILHPYDEGNVCFSCGRYDDNGTIRDYTATIDEDGEVNIVLIGTQLADTDIVKIHYLELK